MIQDLLNNALVHALGWTLVHSLWLALLLALITRLIFLKVDAGKANLRYRISLAALSGILVGAVLIFVHYYQQFELPTADLGPEVIMEANDGVLFDWELLAPVEEQKAGLTWEQVTLQLERYFPVLVFLWLLGAVFMGFRLVGSWLYLRRMGTQGIQEPTGEWRLIFKNLCTKMGVRRPVQLYWSERVQEPITLRHLKPVVLFPLGLLSQLSPEQVEIVLLHELAHIRRWDYLVNWLQSLLELLFFYHPAVWWLSAQVRTAREHCCDDLVIQPDQGRRMLYAQTLTQVSAYSLNLNSKLAMSYNGNNQSFTFRVKRLFGQVDQSRSWQKPMLSGLLVLIFLALVLVNSTNLMADDNRGMMSEEDLLELLDPEIRNLVLEEEIPVLDTIPIQKASREEKLKEGAETLFGLKDLSLVQENKDKKKAVFTNGEFIGYGEISGTYPKEYFDIIKIEDGKKAMAIYGPKAEYGAFDFISKNRIKGGSISFTDSLDVFRFDPYDYPPKPELATTGDSLPAYFVDGKRVHGNPKEVIPNLTPEMIASVDVLKGESAIVEGERFPNGIVMIYTKKYIEKTKADESKPESELTPPLIVIDGIRQGFGKEKIAHLKPEQIATINVLKGESATDKHGEEAKNGVIEVFTKPESELAPPLIIIDGIRQGFGKEKIAHLKPEQIATINVLKGESATDKHGEEAKNGVIEVFTKPVDASIETKEKDGANVVVRGIRSSVEKDPLFVVDGVIMEKGKVEVEELDPNDIETINVLKGESATKKYGDQGENGVVEINTKNGKKPMSTSMKMGKTLKKSVFKYGPKGKTQKMNPLVVFNEEPLGKVSKVGGKFKEGEMDMIRFSGPTKDLIKNYGAEAKDGVVFVTKFSEEPEKEENELDNAMVYINGEKKGFWKDIVTTIDKTQIKTVNIYGKETLPDAYADSPHDIVLIDMKEQISKDGEAELSFRFFGDAKIEEPGQEPTLIKTDKMTMTLKDQKPASTEGENKIMRFSSEGGISVQTLIRGNGKLPLLILDGKVVASNDPVWQQLAPEAVKQIIFIEEGPALLPYGDAAKFGLMRIYTEAGISKESSQSNSIKISEQAFEDYLFKAGPKGQEKLVDPLVILNGKAVGKHSEAVNRYRISADEIETVTFSGFVEEALVQKFGEAARNGIVTVRTKKEISPVIPMAEMDNSNYPLLIEKDIKVFPNPFGQSTRVSFKLMKEATVKISVYNAQGQLVKVIMDDKLPAGPQQVDWDSANASIGNYTIVLESGGKSVSKTVVKQ